MNYDNLHTTAEILEAFQGCRDAGEEIDLFEALAWRDEPPVEAFIEIVRKIKLEPVLALVTQALGWVKNEDVLQRLKKSEELLEILSNLTKSGSTDLIRWSAAKSIIAIGFDFIAVSQHLTEMPSVTVEKIVDSKKKVLVDFETRRKSDEKIIDRSDYKDFINFWVYGSTYDLRVLTSQYCGETSSIVVSEVVKYQKIHGIKETNKLLQRVENHQYSDEFTKQACENELFERLTYLLSAELLSETRSSDYAFTHLILNQGHSLQSNDPKFRLTAASIILKSDKNRLDTIKSFGSELLLISKAISACSFDLGTSFSYENMVYEEMAEIIDNLRIAIILVSRENTIKHLIKYFDKLSKDLCLLSPGFTWKQIMVLEEIERQREKEAARSMREEAARQAAIREEDAKKEAARQAVIKAAAAKKEAARQAAIREEDAKKEAARQAVIKAAAAKKEAARQAAIREEEAKKEAARQAAIKAAAAKKILIYLLFGAVAIAVLYPVFICLGAFFNGKMGQNNPPFAALIASMILGPIALFESVLVLAIFVLGCIFGAIPFDNNAQSMIGLHLVILFGSSITTPAYLGMR
jgi:hypothetical protein